MTSWNSAALSVLVAVFVGGFALGWIPALRRKSAVVMAAVVGAGCLAASAYVLWREPLLDWRQVLLGAAGSLSVWHLMAAAAALGVAWASFRVEARASVGWAGWQSRRRRIPGGPILLANAIDRSEAMRAVAVSAKTPMIFALLSVWTAVAEELFYRGAYLQAAHAAGWGAAVAIGMQAVWYALNHVAFGPPALLGKLLLGLGLGGVGWGFGALATIPAHGFFQYMVLSQFATRRKSSRASAVSA